ncbi:putative uncharacterized protein [Phascolarctobacterium succinatutens CAG:287]|uniref:Fimbrial assembly protein PilN n=1 Tax=Phascolarctobacterium succinatutens CAG:287 TaxID=1263101 RepID=R6WZY0_9FIRM|nr:hypothetical protein [Phascolarctobacterium succinatutens]CDD09596.1 putative uncharacterized protein [Phascolarctobacterium succinatutens CAG:287]
MKLGEKAINTLACVATLIAIGLLVNAWSLWTERQLAVAKTDKLQVKLTRQMRFANEHSDYETYKTRLLSKQNDLEKKVEQQLSLNNGLQRLQKQALAQGLQLSKLQMEGKPVALQNGLQMQTLNVSTVGEFYSLLRWLRQVERNGCKVKELRLQSIMETKDVLKIDIFLEFYFAN